MHFPVSGVDVAVWVPPLVSFAVSLFTSTGGLSGAFVLLPFQVSVLNFTSPAVTPTNHFYNLVAIPSGIYRFIKEGRMTWPVAWVIISGTLPGVIIGSLLRIHLLPDPRAFKLFVGFVLLYIGGRMLYETIRRPSPEAMMTRELEQRFQKLHTRGGQDKATGDVDAGSAQKVQTLRFNLRKVEYRFYGETFSFSTMGLFGLVFVVGIIGGIYGIGGGAIIAPFLVTFYRLPVYTIAGPALMGTFLTSIVGVLFFMAVGPVYAHKGLAVSPDWMLGLLFGLGGLCGIYLGARLQKFIAAKWIKTVLGTAITSLALIYVAGFFC
jgi:uncharacterized membrane protein YfcA